MKKRCSISKDGEREIVLAPLVVLLIVGKTTPNAEIGGQPL